MRCAVCRTLLLRYVADGALPLRYVDVLPRLRSAAHGYVLILLPLPLPRTLRSVRSLLPGIRCCRSYAIWNAGVVHVAARSLLHHVCSPRVDLRFTFYRYRARCTRSRVTCDSCRVYCVVAALPHTFAIRCILPFTLRSLRAFAHWLYAFSLLYAYVYCHVALRLPRVHVDFAFCLPFTFAFTLPLLRTFCCVTLVF